MLWYQGRNQPVSEVYAKNPKAVVVVGGGGHRKAPISEKLLDFIKFVNDFFKQINARYIPYL